MKLSPNLLDARRWLVEEWSEKLCGIVESMSNQRPSLRPRNQANSADHPPESGLIWCQSFAISDEPGVWIVTPGPTCVDLGRRTLEAAGVEHAEVADSQNTYLELLNQSMSALGQSISIRLDMQAAASEGESITAIPAELDWMPISLEFAHTQLEPIWFGASQALLGQLAARVGRDDKPVAERATEPEQSTETAADTHSIATGSSQTFDLLLDVAMPVSISFGRTFLPLKDVLKLNSGSVVELDRTITEPVEVIVNNCVIARGEVVVVDGNYGVRIQQIASRYDRLRTGKASTLAKNALPAN